MADKSLDEVIAEKKIPFAGKNRRGGAGGGPMRSGRGGAPARRGGPPVNRPWSSRSMPTGQWQHDRYQNGSARNPMPLMGMAVSNLPVKLVISNLDYNVSDGDIRELFGEFGSMTGSAVHYDSNGVSLGSAQVIYSNKNAAYRAKQQYNGVHLDGRPMNISVDGEGVPGGLLGSASSRVSGAPAFRPPRPTNNSSRPQQSRGGAPRGRGGRGGRGGRTGGGEKPKQKTAEELDAEMDSYLEDAKKSQS